jgi:hypothetical protein
VAGVLVGLTLATLTLAGYASAAETPKPGQSFRDCDDGCPEMVVVPSGRFTMGSSEFGEGPTRGMTIAKPLASFGYIRTTVMRVWDEDEHLPLIRELP